MDLRRILQETKDEWEGKRRRELEEWNEKRDEEGREAEMAYDEKMREKDREIERLRRRYEQEKREKLDFVIEKDKLEAVAGKMMEVAKEALDEI
ncbi:hypothetical protein PENTCL1PPCAC_11498 [Pristionchus entomophagus]|uniref:Uncharacterized protein n=1 Tax=Pristionchus entomophagus TaxID=358040 RepID=A0AAV5T921_9BILA|nr:hypothetical protein PENTCL1PPCAC_11498 [Pristionchus entomophagus]